MSGLRFRMTDSWKKGSRYIAEFRIIKDDGTRGGVEPTDLFFEIEKEPYSIYYSLRFYTLVHNKKNIATFGEVKEVADELGVSMDELSKITEDAEEYMRDQGIVPHEGKEDFEESRSRKGRLVKESHKPIRKRTIKENRLSPRFTKLLKEAYGKLDTDFSKLVFKCVEVTVNDKRYTASCKEGDVLDFDGLVELAKDYEPINGNVEFDVRTNQDTAEECLILSLSTSDVSGTEEVEDGYEYEEGEELLVAEYWFTVRVDDADSLNEIGDEVIKQCYGD